MYREEIEFAAKYFRWKLSDSDTLTSEIDQIFKKNRISILYNLFHKGVGKGLIFNSLYEAKHYLDTKIRKRDYKKRNIANRSFKYKCKNLQ